MEIELHGDLNDIPTKLETFISTVSSLMSQTLDTLPSLLNKVANTLTKYASIIENSSHTTKSKGVSSAGPVTASPAKGEKNTNPATTDAKTTNLHNELVDLFVIDIVTQYYNKKLLYEKYYDKMLKKRKSSKIINYDVLTQKRPITLQIYKEDGIIKVILNVKIDFNKPLKEQDPLNELNDLADKKRKRIGDLKTILEFKFEGDNTPIFIQPDPLEKELSDLSRLFGNKAVLKLLKKVKKLENKLRQKRKREETEDEEDAEGQDQDIPSQTDQGNEFATPEKSKDSGEAQAEQISPSTLEAAQILTNVASEGFKGSQAPPGSKIYTRKPKSTATPTKVLDFEEPAESQVNTGSTPSAQVNTGNTPSAQVNTAELNTGETERVQRREGKAPMTEKDLQAEVQASKKSKELQELADLEAAQRLQATMNAETQRQIDLDALLARRLVEQEEEAAKEARATEFDYIQARINTDQILAEKIQQEEREQYSIEDRARFLHDTIAAQRKFLAEQRYAAIRNKPPTISQLRNQMITYLKHVANKKHAELKSKSFEEIQVLYERYKKQDQTFVAIGSEEDERAVKKMNEQAANKEKEQKTESVHEEVKEEEGAKKRKLGTRRKLKAKRRKYTSASHREDVSLGVAYI
ncbi:hypothetical protein Tco_1130513 [Tanacetum coccineum]